MENRSARNQYGLLPVTGVTGIDGTVGTAMAPGVGISTPVLLGVMGLGMLAGGAGTGAGAPQPSHAGAQQSPLCFLLCHLLLILSSRFGRAEPHVSQAGAQVGAGAGAQHFGAGAGAQVGAGAQQSFWCLWQPMRPFILSKRLGFLAHGSQQVPQPAATAAGAGAAGAAAGASAPAMKDDVISRRAAFTVRVLLSGPGMRNTLADSRPGAPLQLFRLPPGRSGIGRGQSFTCAIDGLENFS